jgi:hypothetical protein
MEEFGVLHRPSALLMGLSGTEAHHEIFSDGQTAPGLACYAGWVFRHGGLFVTIGLVIHPRLVRTVGRSLRKRPLEPIGRATHVSGLRRQRPREWLRCRRQRRAWPRSGLLQSLRRAAARSSKLSPHRSVYIHPMPRRRHAMSHSAKRVSLISIDPLHSHDQTYEVWTRQYWREGTLDLRRRYSLWTACIH